MTTKSYLLMTLTLLINLSIKFTDQLTETITASSQFEGTIYTGAPDTFDSYYLKQKYNLNKFSNDLNFNKNKLHYGDIWLRDIAPVITNKIVKFKYDPSYLDSNFKHNINKRFNKWLKNQNLDIIKSDIILDGGNFVYNNKDTVIITNRILSDNSQYTKNALITKLKKLLNVNNIILINEEPGDVLGHADGMVNFINANTLLISSFQGVNTVKRQIKNILPNVNFVDIPSAYTSKGQYDNTIPSAKGLYVNILETDTKLYVPQYNLPQDKIVINIIKKHTSKEIIPINVSRISTMGGSIHCLTWYLPARFNK